VRFVEGVRIPHHSMLVVATEGQVAALESHPDVYWVGDFDAHYKYPAALQSWAETHLATANTADLVVVLHSVASSKMAERILANWAKEIKSADVTLTVRPITRTDRVRVTVAASQLFLAVQWLAKQVGTLWIEPAVDTRSFANVATGIVENGVSQPSSVLNAVGLNGGGTNFEIVSLADTGLNFGSCFFGQTTPPTPAFDPTNKIVSYVTEAGASSTDVTGHGTAMAGLIAGDPQSSFVNYHGLAPKAKIAFTAVSANADGGANAPADIIQYLDNAKNTYQSSIIVGAFGTAAPVPWYSTNDEDVDNWLYTFPNILAIFAAGNFGQTQGTTNAPGVQLASPAVAKNVLSVGASQNDLASIISYAADSGDAELANATAADNSQFGKNILAPFSSKGPSPDGRFKPDVVAPGMGIYTADTTACGVTPVEGTSFAAALVGGAAVLARQYFRAGYRNTGTPVQSDGIPSPSSALIKAVLINSGVGLDGYSPAANQFFGTNNQVPHPAYGFGRVQLNNALWVSGTAGFETTALFQDATFYVKQGDTVQFCFEVTDSTKALKITMAWTDLAGSSVAGYALTNDLDLLVMDPNGRTFFANGLTAFDSINNVEQVIVQNPVVGNWVALIYGHSIDSQAAPQGQRYALAVSGNVDSASGSCPTRCPHACNGLGTCNQGICTCNSGRFGVDCSLTACPNNCTAADGSVNGICNSVTSKCECAPQFAGDDCRLPASSTIIRRKKGLSNGAIAGIAIGTFFAGAIICGVIGFVAAIQYLIWKRNKHKRILEEGQK
jgi:hypothetical protein